MSLKMLLSYYIFSEKFNHNVFSIVLRFFQIYLNCSIVNKNYLIVWKCKENLKQFNANFELKILNSFSEWIYWRKLDSVIPHLKYIIYVKWTETSIKYKLYMMRMWQCDASIIINDDIIGLHYLQCLDFHRKILTILWQ